MRVQVCVCMSVCLCADVCAAMCRCVCMNICTCVCASVCVQVSAHRCTQVLPIRSCLPYHLRQALSLELGVVFSSVEMLAGQDENTTPQANEQVQGLRQCWGLEQLCLALASLCTLNTNRG